MAKAPLEIVSPEPRDLSLWSPLVLMASAVAAFAIFTVFLVADHRFTDRLLDRLPAIPGWGHPASDAPLVAQVRVLGPVSANVVLADRSRAFLWQATVVNDSALPLTGIELALEGHAGGKKIAAFEGGCGKNVSERLIKRLTRGEVTALMELPAGEDLVLQPGERAGCQLVLTGLRAEVDEATYRVTEARPASAHFSGPDHPRDPARPSAG